MAQQIPIEQQQAVVRIAQALGETAPGPRGQIRAIVRLCGPEQAQTWLEQVQAIEADGGMLTEDGTRRRSPGGVYFKIVRDALFKAGQKELVAEIFWKRGARQTAGASTSGAPRATAPASTGWADRGPLIAESRSGAGKVTTVKVTVIGRPAKVVERQDFTLLMMKHSGALPSLPKGIPVPPKVPETSYVIYIGAKQWRGVASALSANPDDVLIVEGAQVYDAEYAAITVFATNTTTRALQQAKRQTQQQGG